MNANEALHWMEHDTGIMSCNDKAWPVVLRALRLLAAAEANDGSTPETDAIFEDMAGRPGPENAYTDEMGDELRHKMSLMEQRCTGLAARVRELEPDAARYVRLKAMFDHGGVTIRLIGEVDKLGIPLVTYEYTEWEPLQIAIDAERSK